MKLITFILLVFSFSSTLFAQDIIIKKSGDEINSKILEITTGTIKYIKFDFSDEPIRNIATSEVFMVIYENGKREKFTTQFEQKRERKEAVQKESEPQMDYYPGSRSFFNRMNNFNEEGGYVSLAA